LGFYRQSRNGSYWSSRIENRTIDFEKSTIDFEKNTNEIWSPVYTTDSGTSKTSKEIENQPKGFWNQVCSFDFVRNTIVSSPTRNPDYSCCCCSSEIDFSNLAYNFDFQSRIVTGRFLHQIWEADSWILIGRFLYRIWEVDWVI